MRAIIIKQFGGVEVFEQAEVPKPKVTDGHLIIKVAATSVNPVDFKIRKLGLGIAPMLPAILHGDVAGIVAEVGKGVTKFKAGDEVYGCAGGLINMGGALADYMSADASLVAHKPKTLSMAESATLPLVSLTAWEGLIDKITLQKEQSVLIHAATGGVGHIALQIAKIKNANVFVTGSSEEKLTLAKELGADVGINYKLESVETYTKKYTGGKGFDVVYDTVGGKTLDDSFLAAKIYGTVVSCQLSNSHNLSVVHGRSLTIHGVFMLIPMLHGINRAHHGNILAEVAALVDDGKIRPLVDKQVFNFSEVGKAHQLLESGKAIGKIAVVNEQF
jgi:NADPH:quinone reductase